MQLKGLMQYKCGCVVSYDYEADTESPAIYCKTHHKDLMFKCPHKYKGDYTIVNHAKDYRGNFQFAIHRCKKDQYGFITQLETKPLTEIISFEPKNNNSHNEINYNFKLLEDKELRELTNDVCCMMQFFPKHLLVDRIS